jgi:hypothetical protein
MALSLVLVMVITIFGCGGSSDRAAANGAQQAGASAPEVSIDDLKTAYMLSVAVVITASMASAFGQPIEGATLDEEENLTLDKFDLTQFASEDTELEFPFATVSGTAVRAGEATEVDLTFEGGEVETLQYVLTREQLQAETGFTTLVTVNGREVELALTLEDFQGE